MLYRKVENPVIRINEFGDFDVVTPGLREIVSAGLRISDGETAVDIYMSQPSTAESNGTCVGVVVSGDDEMPMTNRSCVFTNGLCGL